MTEDQMVTLLTQHSTLLAEIERLWFAFILIVFLGLIFILAIIFVAIWITRTINRRQSLTEAKWNELVELLIHNAREHAS